MSKSFTAEFVSPKHPDKICDQIADAILDEILKKDNQARVAVEAMGGHGKLVLMGEVTTRASVDYEKIASEFVSKNTEIMVNISQQSPEISRGVDSGGAGDQGVMIGYATNETESYMPTEYQLARSLCQHLYELYPYDGKVQVTVRDYEISDVVASFQNVARDDLSKSVGEWLKQAGGAVAKTHINPSGDWRIGGFEADTGLTGRKIVIDNYGPRVPIGGGSFSGKDPSKVDRSGAYMARYIAVDLLKKHTASEVLVRLAYAIGEPQPIESTAVIDGKPHQIKDYDLTPKAIIQTLNLNQPTYRQTASFGHFGRGFKWG